MTIFFFVSIQPPLNDSRLEVINLAFDKMDKTGDGQITIDDLKLGYNVKFHPNYMNGKIVFRSLSHSRRTTNDLIFTPSQVICHRTKFLRCICPNSNEMEVLTVFWLAKNSQTTMQVSGRWQLTNPSKLNSNLNNKKTNPVFSLRTHASTIQICHHSSSIDSDVYFILLVRTSWKL